MQVSLGQIFDRNVTQFPPHKALKLIAFGKMTFDKKGRTTPCGTSGVAAPGLLTG